LSWIKFRHHLCRSYIADILEMLHSSPSVSAKLKINLPEPATVFFKHYFCHLSSSVHFVVPQDHLKYLIGSVM